VLREAVDAQREGGESASLMLSSLASGRLHAGRTDEAADLFREALVEAKSFDHLYGIAVAMAGIGESLLQAGHPDDARPHLVEARERFDELNVTPGIAETELRLGLVNRLEGNRVDAARFLLRSLTTPGETWYDESPVWVVQYAASVLDDLSLAATLIGAAAADYERRTRTQPAYVLADLDTTRKRLAEQLDEEEFSRCMRAGARRTRTEFIELAARGLEAFIGADDDQASTPTSRS
jgi:tetratricopeptide (TPR) repeat protein